MLLLAALLCVSLAACGAKKTEEVDDAPMAGGWTLTADKAAALPAELRDAFTQAAGDKLIPIALVGEQVVAGKNFMFLCNDGGAYKMIVIYRDFQGKAELTQNFAFDLTDYTQGKSAEPGQALPGGWAAPEDLSSVPLTEEAQKAFDKAIGNFVGSSIEPMALLGTQVVAGINYAILCRVTPVVPDAVSTIQVVTVYADLQGNAEFTSFCMLDHARYNK